MGGLREKGIAARENANAEIGVPEGGANQEIGVPRGERAEL
jgi:hypothetical protein